MTHAPRRTWRSMVELVIADYPAGVTFTLAEITRSVIDAGVYAAYPHNADPDSTLRARLQDIRDDGIITFVDYDGTYYRNGATIESRLDAIRAAIVAESVSYGELAELESLAAHIPADDTLLREWAGVPEFDDADTGIDMYASGAVVIDLPTGTVTHAPRVGLTREPTNLDRAFGMDIASRIADGDTIAHATYRMGLSTEYVTWLDMHGLINP